MKRDINEIVDEYGQDLFKIAYVKLKSETDAEDIVQEVFYKYIKYPLEFKNLEQEKHWLFKVTVNLCKNLLKSGWKTRTVPFEEEYLKLQYEEQYNVLEEVQKLDYKYRGVVQLFYFEQLNTKQISKILKISESNARVRLNRARKDLKLEIERGEALDERKRIQGRMQEN